MTSPDAGRFDLTLSVILAQAWTDLQAAAASRRHPFRLGQLATVHPVRGVDLRTVVIRGVDRAARRLTFYSDRRAQKISELAHDPRVAWLFYDPAQKVQLRISATARLIDDGDAADAAWDALDESQRGEYAIAAVPGSVIRDASGHSLIETVTEEAARRQFCMIECRVTRLDWLRLDPDGHRRARFEWSADGDENFVWIVP